MPAYWGISIFFFFTYHGNRYLIVKIIIQRDQWDTGYNSGTDYGTVLKANYEARYKAESGTDTNYEVNDNTNYVSNSSTIYKYNDKATYKSNYGTN